MAIPKLDSFELFQLVKFGHGRPRVTYWMVFQTFTYISTPSALLIPNNHPHPHPLHELSFQTPNSTHTVTFSPTDTFKMRVATLVVAGLASIAACIPADQVVTNVKQITTLSRNLQVPAKGLTVLDGPLLAVGQGKFPRTWAVLLLARRRICFITNRPCSSSA